jgi:hypothetical protein
MNSACYYVHSTFFLLSADKHYPGEKDVRSPGGRESLKTSASRMKSRALEANEFYRSNKLDIAWLLYAVRCHGTLPCLL